MEKYRNFSLFIILISAPDLPHFYYMYMLGGNLGSLLYGDDDFCFNMSCFMRKCALYLRNISALAVNCCVIIHCLEVGCKEGQITSAQRE